MQESEEKNKTGCEHCDKTGPSIVYDPIPRTEYPEGFAIEQLNSFIHLQSDGYLAFYTKSEQLPEKTITHHKVLSVNQIDSYYDVVLKSFVYSQNHNKDETKLSELLHMINTFRVTNSSPEFELCFWVCARCEEIANSSIQRILIGV